MLETVGAVGRGSGGNSDFRVLESSPYQREAD
jgi:hypothetical protein